MEPIKFNYPPDVAAKFVDEMTEYAKNDPKASEKERAVFEDIHNGAFCKVTIDTITGNRTGGTGK